MSNPATRRGYFAAGLAGVVVGALLVTTLVVTVLPVEAATGDPVIAGQANAAGRPTKITSRSTSTLRLTNNRPSGGVGLEIITPPGQPPLRVNRAAWVQNLNADLLDGRQAWDLTRATYGAIDGWAMSPPGNGNVVTASITAPTRGLLVVSGSWDSTSDHVTPVHDTIHCYLRVDGAEVTGSRRTLEFSYDNTVLPQYADGDSREQDCATDGVVAVTSGAHNVALAVADNHWITIRDASIWAIFVPFDGNGNTP